LRIYNEIVTGAIKADRKRYDKLENTIHEIVYELMAARF